MYLENGLLMNADEINEWVVQRGEGIFAKLIGSCLVYFVLFL